MKWINFTIIFTIFTNIVADELIFVVQFSRHGARYPRQPLFKWNLDPMGLTPAGMRQQYILGRELRNRYIDHYKFLDPIYNPKQILLQSSGHKRTLNSIYAQLAGFFEQTGYEISNKNAELAVPPNKENYTKFIKTLGNYTVDYKYKIMPIKSVQTSLDFYLEPQEACLSGTQVRKQYREINNEKIREFNREHKDVFEDLKNVFNISGDLNISYAIELRDMLTCGLVQDELNIPEETILDLLKRTFPIYQFFKYDMHLFIKDGNYSVSKIYATPFLRKLKDWLLSASYNNLQNTNNSELKYVLNMGSDTLIHSMLLELGFNKDKESSVFASILLFELFKKENAKNINDYYIRFTYNKKINVTYTILEFIEIINKNTYSDNDFQKYCNNYVLPMNIEEKAQFNIFTIFEKILAIPYLKEGISMFSLFILLTFIASVFLYH